MPPHLTIRQIEDSLAASLAALGPGELYDPARRRIVLDRLWHTPQHAESSLRMLDTFLDQRGWLSAAGTLVVADKVKGPFSILPLCCALALSRKKHLLIWKETADSLHGTSELFGNVEVLADGNAPILICHDVLVYGYAIVKMLVDLRTRLDPLATMAARLQIASLVRLASEDDFSRLLQLIEGEAKYSLKPEQFAFLADVSGEWDQLSLDARSPSSSFSSRD